MFMQVFKVLANRKTMSLDPSGLFCAYILKKHSSSLQGENREHTKIETIYLSHQTVYTLIRGFDFS